MIDVPFIGVKKLDKDAILPKFAKSGDACADLFVRPGWWWILRYGATVVVPTGIAIEVPQGYEAQIRSRSGLASKGIVVANSPGTIDSGYRGEVGVILHNTSMKEVYIGYVLPDKENEVRALYGEPIIKIAQIAIREVPDVIFQEVEELSTTERGTGGFGSTGVK